MLSNLFSDVSHYWHDSLGASPWKNLFLEESGTRFCKSMRATEVMIAVTRATVSDKQPAGAPLTSALC